MDLKSKFINQKRRKSIVFSFSFQIELIKAKQGGGITKQLIRDEQLEQSKLRFTRIFLNKENQHVRDDITTEYSSLMTECK